MDGLMSDLAYLATQLQTSAELMGGLLRQEGAEGTGGTAEGRRGSGRPGRQGGGEGVEQAGQGGRRHDVLLEVLDAEVPLSNNWLYIALASTH